MKRQNGNFRLPLAPRIETSVNPDLGGAVCSGGVDAWRTRSDQPTRERTCRSAKLRLVQSVRPSPPGH